MDSSYDAPRIVAHDKTTGAPLPGLRIKTMASQRHYLRLVRDVSFIDESAWDCTCNFTALPNLRKFIVTTGSGAVFSVDVPTLYPQKPPLIYFTTLPPHATRTGRTLQVDAEGRLISDDLVGSGWQPMRGLHGLLHVLCHEFSARHDLAALTLSHGGSYAVNAERAAVFVAGDLRVAIVLDAVSATSPSVVPATALLLAHLRAELSDALLVDPSETAAVATLERASRVVAIDVGVAVCIAIVSARTIISVNLGTVGAAVLQLNHRRCVDLTRAHDAFDADEVARLPVGVRVAKYGPHVRLVDDFCPFTRCLGLAERSFILRSPHVVVRPRELRDAVVLVAARATLEHVSALEACTIVGTMVSAHEMGSELARIAGHRGDASPTLAVLCL